MREALPLDRGAAQCTRASAWGASRTDVERELVRGG